VSNHWHSGIVRKNDNTEQIFLFVNAHTGVHMRKILRPTLLVTLLATQASMFAITSAHAEESIQPAEPEIVIRNEDNKTFYEYRVNGVLKEIKVVPKIGPTYYLVPQDGNAWIREDRSQVLVPSWVLFEW
jgi:hypothetical protein